jgi:hypothetical protein
MRFSLAAAPFDKVVEPLERPSALSVGSDHRSSSVCGNAGTRGFNAKRLRFSSDGLANDLMILSFT